MKKHFMLPADTGFHCLCSGKEKGKALLLLLQGWAKPLPKDHVLQATTAHLARLQLFPFPIAVHEPFTAPWDLLFLYPVSVGRTSHRRGRTFMTSTQQDSSVNSLTKVRSLDGAVYCNKKRFHVTKGWVFLLDLVEQKRILNAVASFLLLRFY